jgi:hypothetical protein
VQKGTETAMDNSKPISQMEVEGSLLSETSVEIERRFVFGDCECLVIVSCEDKVTVGEDAYYAKVHWAVRGDCGRCILTVAITLIGGDGEVKSHGTVDSTNVAGRKSPLYPCVDGGVILQKMKGGDKILWSASLSCRKDGRRQCLQTDDCEQDVVDA